VAKQGPRSKPSPEPLRPGARTLAAAAALALVAGGWSLHLWRQLSIARAGGTVTCPFDAEGGCADVWQSGLALAVERATHLPVAAHGVLWALVALALPLAALAARARGRTGEVSWSAALVTAAAGVVVVLGLALAQLAEGGFCGSCTLQYVFVLAYAGVCFAGMTRVDWPALARGGLLAAGCAVLGGVALAAVAPRERAPALPSAVPEPSSPGAAAAPGEATGDLASFLATLPPPVRQAVSNALRDYAARPAKPLREPRALVGSPMAPIRITDFADFLCSHCAALHATLAELRRKLPADAFAVESRYFPLDGQCNPRVSRASEDGVRCSAARALICLEGDARAFEIAGQLYARQRELTTEMIFEAAAPARGRDALAACMASPETAAKLLADVDWAEEHGIQGTPLVLVNGREAAAFPAFLYALILAGGDPAHPAFAALPPPTTPAKAAGG
jgi:serine/threonine-protein kinase